MSLRGTKQSPRVLMDRNSYEIASSFLLAMTWERHVMDGSVEAWWAGLCARPFSLWSVLSPHHHLCLLIGPFTKSRLCGAVITPATGYIILMFYPVSLPGTGSCLDKFFLIVQGAFTGYLLKIFMEIGKVVKPAFITELFQRQFIFDKQFAGMPYPDLQ